MYLQADMLRILRRIPWFVDLSQARLERLASIASVCHLEAGDVLFHEGDREDCLYVVLEGQVSLEVEVPTRGQVPVYTAESLDVIGWSSMTPIIRMRTATVHACQQSLLLCLNSKILQQMCDEDHELGYVIMHRLSNVVANRLLTTRLCLLELIATTPPETAER